jgi:hypothetical protein
MVDTPSEKNDAPGQCANDPKRPYVKPQLVLLGKVRELTAGKGGSTGDASSRRVF